jgi:outer membrane protein TolC
VVEVQQDLNRARMEVAQSRGRQLENMVKLYAATAADWRPAAN